METIIYNFYCCKKIQENIKDPNFPLVYIPQFRECSIQYLDSEHIIQDIWYCPWCSMKLPKELRKEYFELLEKEYGLDLCITDIKTDPRVPKEFKSDEWWKKRGL